MLRVRFCNNADIIIKEENIDKKYFELIDAQFLDMFLPSHWEYTIVEETEEADICIVGTQHTDNSLLRENELNIFFSIENLSAGRTHYQHLNTFGRYGNPFIKLYIYNDTIQPNDLIIPAIYQRIKYFNKLNDINSKLYYSEARNFLNKMNTPFEEKKFCLFISQNMLNPNKMIILKMLSTIGPIDSLQQLAITYPELKTSNCHNGFELLKLFNQYKFIICFENSKTEGYITEKIFNVFLAKSIPIYDGDPKIDNFIHKGAYLPFDDKILNKIQMLKDNETLYNAIVDKPKVKDLDYDLINDNFDRLLSPT